MKNPKDKTRTKSRNGKGLWKSRDCNEETRTKTRVCLAAGAWAGVSGHNVEFNRHKPVGGGGNVTYDL